jgi:hypothetical protein
MERVKTSLETEQEKLATLVKNLSVDPSQTEGAEKGEEPAVSEEWLQSLKERRKVRAMLYCEKLYMYYRNSIILAKLSLMGGGKGDYCCVNLFVYHRSCWSRSVIVTRGRRSLARGGVPPRRTV